MEVIHKRVAGLDVRKKTVVACVRLQSGSKVQREIRTLETTTADLETLLACLSEMGCTHVAMEATGVYWKPVGQASCRIRLKTMLVQCAPAFAGGGLWAAKRQKNATTGRSSTGCPAGAGRRRRSVPWGRRS